MQLTAEIQRIVGKDDLREAALRNWEEMAPKIVAQARLEASHKKRLATALETLDTENSKCVCVCVCACSVGLLIRFLDCQPIPMWVCGFLGTVLLTITTVVTCTYYPWVLCEYCMWELHRAYTVTFTYTIACFLLDFFQGDDTLTALVLLPYLLPDVRSKPDPEKIIHFYQVSRQGLSLHA